MPEFTPSISVSSLNGTTGFRLNGDVSGDQAGGSLANAGDVNGDGRADLLIGARTASGTAGAAYLVLGTASAPAAATGLAARVAAGTAYRFQGELGADQVGYSVSSAGDVNGDGFADLLIGAPGADFNGSSSGRTYLIFGGSHLEALDTADTLNDNRINLALLTQAHGYRIDGPPTLADEFSSYYANSGASVSGGDVNGDGFSDIIIGSPYALGTSGFNGYRGNAFVIFGGSANLASLDGNGDGRIVGSFNRTFTGGNSSDYVGWSIDASGDVNGDGIVDFIVGARGSDLSNSNISTNEGAAYIVFGRLNGVPAFPDDPTDLNGAEGVKIGAQHRAIQPGRQFPMPAMSMAMGSVTSSSEPRMCKPGAARSTSSLEAGCGTPSSTLGPSDGTNGFRMLGVRTEDFTGSSVANAGDVNGDGFDDLLIGVRIADRLGATNSGAAFVVFGKSDGFAPTINLNSLNGNNGFSITGIAASDALGASAKAVGDLNGDGFDDIAIGAPGVSGLAGATYIVYGHRAQSSVTRNGTDFNDRINGGFGDDVVRGLDGNDTLLGWEGDDTMFGGSGNDTFDGGAGDDDVRAGGGNDVFNADYGDDSVNGGSGIDRVSLANIGIGAAVVNLATGTFTLFNGDVTKLTSIENVTGTPGGDTITGDARNNNLNGAGGNDTIAGGAGNDTIIGAVGRDRLIGDAGLDVFSFNAVTDSAAAPAASDVIVSFVHGADKVDVSAIDAIAGGGGANDTFVFPGGVIGGAFTAAGQARAFQSGGDTVVEFNTTGTSVAEMSIVLLGFTASTLTAVDFTL